MLNAAPRSTPQSAITTLCAASWMAFHESGLEVRGLSANSDVRPADIYTNSALPGRDAALDVTIVSPESARAGQDCLQTAFLGKLHKYRQILPELLRQGIAFKPLVWSTEGSPHPVVRRVMAYVAKQAVQRNGFGWSKEMLRRWQREIGCASQERKAAMIATCLPRHSARSSWLLSGEVAHDAAHLLQ